MLGVVAPVVGSLLKGFMENRQEISKAKAQAKAARLQNGIPGYSDEFLIFIWSAPFVMNFIPFLQPYVVAGFENLQVLPDWYVGGFITITFAVFGIDKLFAWKK